MNEIQVCKGSKKHCSAKFAVVSSTVMPCSASCVSCKSQMLSSSAGVATAESTASSISFLSSVSFLISGSVVRRALLRFFVGATFPSGLGVPASLSISSDLRLERRGGDGFFSCWPLSEAPAVPAPRPLARRFAGGDGFSLGGDDFSLDGDGFSLGKDGF